jgi:protein-S-isoprenylcysteine O-methyltransferase Ste14
MNQQQWMPPTYFKLFLGLALVGHYLIPIRHLISPPSTYLLGLPLLGLGLYLNLAASQLFSRHQTTIKPYESPSYFVRAGIYAWSRNPMYLGLVLFLLGWAILLGSLSPLIAPLGMWMVLNRWFIPYEEQHLRQQFGPLYETYQQQVRRWL